jgi:hypothetical protein
MVPQHTPPNSNLRSYGSHNAQHDCLKRRPLAPVHTSRRAVRVGGGRAPAKRTLISPTRRWSRGMARSSPVWVSAETDRRAGGKVTRQVSGTAGGGAAAVPAIAACEFEAGCADCGFGGPGERREEQRARDPCIARRHESSQNGMGILPHYTD